MSNEAENTEKTPCAASAVDPLVNLQCSCGQHFTRPQSYFDMIKECEEYPTAKRHYERKVKFCDACIRQKIENAFKVLPDILKALAS